VVLEEAFFFAAACFFPVGFELFFFPVPNACPQLSEYVLVVPLCKTVTFSPFLSSASSQFGRGPNLAALRLWCLPTSGKYQHVVTQHRKLVKVAAAFRSPAESGRRFSPQNAGNQINASVPCYMAVRGANRDDARVGVRSPAPQQCSHTTKFFHSLGANGHRSRNIKTQVTASVFCSETALVPLRRFPDVRVAVLRKFDNCPHTNARNYHPRTPRCG